MILIISQSMFMIQKVGRLMMREGNKTFLYKAREIPTWALDSHGQLPCLVLALKRRIFLNLPKIRWNPTLHNRRVETYQ
jgi:hypothetical protein